MAQFAYRAKRGLSETLEGTIEAENQDAAVHRLIDQGLFPILIRPRTLPRQEAVAAARPRRRPARRVRNRVTSRDLLVFTQQLTTLVRAHVELLAAIRILYEQADEGRFKDVLGDIYQATKEGQMVSASLARHPQVFGSLFVNLVRAGEASGRLDEALQQLSESLARQEALKTRVSTALAYPALLLCVGLVSVAVLFNFVIPKLEGMFAQLGSELPLMTRLILRVSGLSQRALPWMLLAVGAVAAIAGWRLRGAALARLAARVMRKLPVVRRLVKNQELVQFTSSLGLLLRSGVLALPSLQIATSGIQDPRLQAQLGRVYEQVALGESLSQSLEAHTDLPAFLIKMLAVGEESGRLDEVLEEISRAYLQQVEADIAIISSLIEPLLIVGMGSVLGVIILSILLPIFQITQTVR